MSVYDRAPSCEQDLLGVDPASLTDAELADHALVLTELAARVEGARLAALAEVDVRQAWAADGYRSTAGWLAHQRRLPLGACRGDVHRARSLRRLPAAAAALAAGDIASAHVRMLVGLLVRPPVAAALVAGGEELLVDQARTLTFAHWVRAVRYFEQVTDPDGAEAAAADAYERRYLRLSQLFDGSWRLDGELDPIGGAALQAALERIDDELFTADRSAAIGRSGPPGEGR